MSESVWVCPRCGSSRGAFEGEEHPTCGRHAGEGPIPMQEYVPVDSAAGATSMLAALTAQFDQAVKATEQVAQMVAAYHQQLLEQGFNPAQALALTLGFQSSLYSNSSSD